MKKTITLLTVVLFTVLSTLAQSNCVAYVAQTPTQKDLDDENLRALQLKLSQILTRCNASNTSLYGAFVMTPSLVVVSNNDLAGGIRAVSTVEGELTIEAHNSLDNSVYNSITVTVSGNGNTQKQAIKSMINSIRPTDPRFVKFVRTTTDRITDYYTDNSEVILQKVETLVAKKDYEAALKFINSVPECVPAYALSAEIAKEIAKLYNDQKGLVKDSVKVDSLGKIAVKDSLAKSITPLKVKPIKFNDMEITIVEFSGNTQTNDITLVLSVKNTANLTNKITFKPTGNTLYDKMGNTYKTMRNSSNSNNTPGGLSWKSSFVFQRVPSTIDAGVPVISIYNEQLNKYQEITFPMLKIAWE